MARLNSRAISGPGYAHEDGQAATHVSPLHELEIAVASCLLWEPTFYETGEERAQRIRELCDQIVGQPLCEPWSRLVVRHALEPIATLAVRARTDYKLRHVPLFLCVQLVRQGERIRKVHAPTVHTFPDRARTH